MLSHRLDEPWMRIRLLAGASVLVVVLGVAAFVFIEGWSFLDALYMTITTLATTGFGEVRPLDVSGRVLTLALIVAGIGLIVTSGAVFAQVIQEGVIGERGRRKRMQRRIEALKDHFIICAYGRVGRTVAREFEAEGIPFVVIDRLIDLEPEMSRDGITYLIADPTHEHVLREAGIDRARGLVSAVDDDAENVYITLTARSLNPEVYIVARAADESTAEKLYKAGADRVISPYVSSGRHMALLALRPQVVDYIEVESEKAGALRLEEVVIDSGSDLIGKDLAALCEEGGCLVLRRADGHTFTNPEASTRLEEGDLLVLLGESKGSKTFERA
ncbi:MAG TPA: potassium channel protein [Actinomycetota bacterium]|nr:potassium channel protein [Actinomycetota bacterium]